MKRALALALLASACGIFSFDQTQPIGQQTIPAGSGPLSFSLVTDVAKQDTGPASAAYLKSASFQVTPHDAPDGNFDFVDGVHVTIAAPGLPSREVASLDPVPRGMTELSLEVDGSIDLLPYVAKGARFTTVATGHYPANATSFDGSVTIHVRL